MFFRAKARGQPDGFDKPVLSEAQGLKAIGGCIENIENFPFMLSLIAARKPFFNGPSRPDT